MNRPSLIGSFDQTLSFFLFFFVCNFSCSLKLLSNVFSSLEKLENFASCSLIFPIYILRTFLGSHKPRVDPLFCYHPHSYQCYFDPILGYHHPLPHSLLGYPIKIKASTSIFLSLKTLCVLSPVSTLHSNLFKG